jgi:hypothetical protein
MSSLRRHSRLLAIAVCCVAAGAIISAVATAGAATSTATNSAHPAAKHLSLRARGARRLLHAVQGSAVIRTADGFASVTFERGTVDSVSGQQLTIAEGTRKATYKTVTVTIPANAVVRDNRQKASLSDGRAGQRVLVLTAPKRTYVIAHTPRRLVH